MGIGNGATLEMVENLLDGSVPAGRALQADSAASADRAAKDGQGNVISSTYVTKSELAAAGGFDAGGTYPNLTAGEAAHAEEADTASSAAYASSAGSADSAVYAETAGSVATATNADNAANAAYATSAGSAVSDGAGNNIAATYATKAELALSGGGSGNFDANGTYPNLTAGTAQNVSALYVHYLHGVDTRGGSGQCVYWNATVVSGSAAALSSVTAAYLRGLGYAEGESFPISGYLDRGGSGSNGTIIGLRLLANDYLAVELIDTEGNFAQFPVAAALSVSSSGENGKDIVRRLQ